VVDDGRRSWAILTDGYLEARNAKTAHGVLRYSRDEMLCVIDEKYAGRTVAEVLPELGRDAPIVATIEEALAMKPTSLLLGVATPGGWMPDSWRTTIITALSDGLEVVNGLHRFLRDDEEFVKTAADNGGSLWDVRDPPADIPLFSGKPLRLNKKVVLTVGTDCAVGKKTTAIELMRAGRAKGASTEFVATGQTGIIIAGKGIAVDRVISDFVAGAAEKLVCETHPSTDYVVIEGQGSLWHPAYSAVTLGLLHGSCAHALVLCHQAGRTAIEEPPYTQLPAMPDLIATYEHLGSVNRPARVACVSVNTKGLTDGEADEEIARIEDETGVPAGDVFLGHAPKLWEAVKATL
jgi:uncharacterized NAD-dependent epimerase/dehydratase family protein